MTLTDQDARALTYLAGRIRTETHGARRWDDAGTYSVIAKLIGRNLPGAVEQVTRHASDPQAKTPGAILRPFLPDAPTNDVRYPPRRDQECRTHPGQYADHCGACRTDRTVTDRPSAQEELGGQPASGRDTAVALARQAMTAVVVCRHGATTCHECDRAEAANDEEQQ